MKDEQELKESVTTVTLDLPTWVWKKLITLAKLQKMSGAVWIKTVICKALKANLKPDRVKWTDIYEAYDMTDEELERLIRQMLVSRVEDDTSYSSSDGCRV